MPRREYFKEHGYYVYILTSERNGTLYIGVSNSLYRRTLEHKLAKKENSFTAKYKTNKLVYFEIYKYIEDAIKKEKQLKFWKRKWKLELIEKFNPTWRDLFEDME